MLMRWDPFREMAGLQQDINRLFEGWSGRENGFGETRFPLMDVSENDQGIVVRALLPGMTKEDVTVSLHQNVLSIAGERKMTDIPESARIIRSERLTGRFQRTLRLGKPVELDKVKAELTDGVLTLTLPLKEEAKPKQIEVAVG
jgi:HSP20 family protein